MITELTANAFLLHMVRNIMGVLLRIGLGEMPPEWAGEVLASRDRRLAAKTAPPDGLYLVRVGALIGLAGWFSPMIVGGGHSLAETALAGNLILWLNFFVFRLNRKLY